MTAVEAAALRLKINCRKVHIVPGNHDKDWTHKDVAGTFIVEPPIVRINIHGQKIVLVALPLMGVAVHVARVLASAWAYPQRG